MTKRALPLTGRSLRNHVRLTIQQPLHSQRLELRSINWIESAWVSPVVRIYILLCVLYCCFSVINNNNSLVYEICFVEFLSIHPGNSKGSYPQQWHSLRVHQWLNNSVIISQNAAYRYKRSSVVCRSAGLSVTIVNAVKRLNRSICRFGSRLGWTKGTMC